MCMLGRSSTSIYVGMGNFKFYSFQACEIMHCWLCVLIATNRTNITFGISFFFFQKGLYNVSPRKGSSNTPNTSADHMALSSSRGSNGKKSPNHVTDRNGRKSGSSDYSPKKNFKELI